MGQGWGWIDGQIDAWMEMGGWVAPRKVCSMGEGAEITRPGCSWSGAHSQEGV